MGLSANGQWNIYFYIVPILIFGPILLTILYKFAFVNLKGLGSELKANRKSKDDDYLDARKRRGFI